MVEILDAMVQHEVAPMVVAFLELPEPAWWEPNRVRVREILDQDVLPHLESRYRLRSGAEHRALYAPQWTFENALLWALTGRVAQVASSSPSYGEYSLERAIVPALEGAPRMRFRLDWGRSAD